MIHVEVMHRCVFSPDMLLSVISERAVGGVGLYLLFGASLSVPSTSWLRRLLLVSSSSPSGVSLSRSMARRWRRATAVTPVTAG